jgi:hypothetical protein
MKFLSIFVIFSSILLLGGCTATTVVPQTGNIFSVTTYGSTAAKTTSAAALKAQNVCEQQDGEVLVLDQATVYQGIDKSQQALQHLADKLFDSNSHEGDYSPEELTYKTTVSFECE